MRLDEMKWVPLGHLGWWLAWTGNDYRRLEVWKRTNEPDLCDGLSWAGDDFGSYMVKAKNKVWDNLDPITAQAIIYHLLGEHADAA